MSLDADIIRNKDEVRQLLADLERLNDEIKDKTTNKSPSNSPKVNDSKSGTFQNIADSPTKASYSRMSEADNETRVQEDYPIPEVAEHEYFDGLINLIMGDSVKKYEEALEENKKRRKIDKEEAARQSEESYQELYSRVVPYIQLENIYRLGGITAFPVKDPHELNDTFLGLRFDIFDRVSRKFTIPHYIILKKEVKNSNWFVFKTTLPKYIPLVAISFKWLNSDLKQFASEIRRYLILIQERACIFKEISNELGSSCKLTNDLDYTKVSFTFSNKIEMIVFCNLFEITNVIVTPLRYDFFFPLELKNRIVMLMKGRVDKFKENFAKVLQECNL